MTSSKTWTAFATFPSIIVITTVLMVHTAFSSTQNHNRLPFAPGERLVFALRWSAVPAGEAVMEVMPMQTINGVQAYHFRLTAESNSFIDVFYKVRDRIDAYARYDMLHTVHYRKKQHEGDTKRNVQIDFDWDNHKAFRTIDKKRDAKPIALKPGTFDPLSVFYFSRTQPLAENMFIESPVTDGKKNVQGVARIVKKEFITVPCGTFETFLIEPDLKHVGGVFEKKKDAKIKLWVTADEQRIPIKIASKVAIGSFIGELVSYKTGNYNN